MIERLVELVGIEPTTSSLRTMASAELSLIDSLALSSRVRSIMIQFKPARLELPQNFTRWSP